MLKTFVVFAFAFGLCTGVKAGGMSSIDIKELPIPVGKLFYPSGWMGDGEETDPKKKTLSLTRTSHKSGNQSVIVTEISYKPGGDVGWAGIYWQYPDKNWGEQTGRNLTGISRISFHAKGGTGGELVKFVSGGIRSSQQSDRHKVERTVELAKEWARYEIDLTGKDLSNVIGAFAWVAAMSDNQGKTIKIYLADLQFE